MALVKKRSQKQEQKTAKDLNGRPTIASGALYFEKADVIAENFLVECKFTDKDYYPLKKSTFEKVQKEALKNNMRTPLMQVSLQGTDNPLAIMRFLDFRSLELDKSVYDCGEVKIIDNKSFRITMEMYNSEYDIDNKMHKLTQFKFVGGKKDLHLVVLRWEDLIYILNQLKLI